MPLCSSNLIRCYSDLFCATPRRCGGELPDADCAVYELHSPVGLLHVTWFYATRFLHTLHLVQQPYIYIYNVSIQLYQLNQYCFITYIYKRTKIHIRYIRYINLQNNLVYITHLIVEFRILFMNYCIVVFLF